ncbi:MAG: HAD-IC family P-type ATPase, partial [Lachnospiraceae bacterium]|nr:HAD-IC family P-type ATPase [Lachnospiraceae bacterium]
MEQEHKEELTKIIITLVAFAIVFACDKIFDLATVFPGPWGWVFPFVLFFAIYVYAAHEILVGAAKHMAKGKIFDEHFLMAIASLGAFALGIYKGVNGMSPDGFEEGCAIVIFYNIGEFFQDLAVDNSRESIEKLMDIRPDTAGLVQADGTVSHVDPAGVAIGDIVEVAKGEKIPLDGVVTEGTPTIDMMALTGESAPLKAEPGTEILSGSINIGESFRFRVTKPYGESTVSKILELVEHASEKKTKAENFIDRFAAVYTPIVVILCVLLAVVPSIITGEWNVWIYRALSFLVVSCPCALVISVPLSFFTGIGRASKEHILVKGSNYLEMIAKARTFVCDKTGTLTVGRRTSADDDAIDPVKPEAKEFVTSLKAGGARIAMLSGDREDVARSVADELGIT